MTALTTFFGQLLLVIRPGSGAELYRGVGAVVLGGLLISTAFTLIVVPAVLSLSMSAKARFGRTLFDRQQEEIETSSIGAAIPAAQMSAQEQRTAV